MTIPSVIGGTVEFAGRVFEVDSPRGLTWLESVGSFRFEPAGDNKPYTVRKESGKGGDYWYGYRKQNGKLHKKYIGKSSELSTAKLEEVAEALNTPPQSRVTDKVTEVTEGGKRVTDRVTDTRDGDRLTALELQVQALQESLEALQEALPGKSDAGNSEELPKVDNEVVERLQNELSNLQTDNQTLRQELEKVKADRVALLESFRELEADRNRLDWEIGIHKADKQKLRDELDASKSEYAKLLESSSAIIHKSKEDLKILQTRLTQERTDREEVEAELTDLKQKSATAREFPDAADLLNQLKAKRKKSSVTLADVEKILEILGGNDEQND